MRPRQPQRSTQLALVHHNGSGDSAPDQRLKPHLYAVGSPLQNVEKRVPLHDDQQGRKLANAPHGPGQASGPSARSPAFTLVMRTVLFAAHVSRFAVSVCWKTGSTRGLRSRCGDGGDPRRRGGALDSPSQRSASQQNPSSTHRCGRGRAACISWTSRTTTHPASAQPAPCVRPWRVANARACPQVVGRVEGQPSDGAVDHSDVDEALKVRVVCVVKFHLAFGAEVLRQQPVNMHPKPQSDGIRRELARRFKQRRARALAVQRWQHEATLTVGRADQNETRPSATAGDSREQRQHEPNARRP